MLSFLQQLFFSQLEINHVIHKPTANSWHSYVEHLKAKWFKRQKLQIFTNGTHLLLSDVYDLVWQARCDHRFDLSIKLTESSDSNSNCQAETIIESLLSDSEEIFLTKQSRFFFDYLKVATSRPVYYSILELFGQREHYISIKLPLHKPSENH